MKSREILARVGALGLVLAAAGTARADDPGARGPYATRAHTFNITVQGQRATIDVRLPAAGSFARPVVLINHGWIVTAGLYAGVAEHLASRGFAAVLYQQTNGFSADTRRWANELKDAVSELGRLSAQATSPIFGELDMDKVGAMGHSRGGAAVTILAGIDPRVKAVVSLSGVNQYTYYETCAAVANATGAYFAMVGQGEWLCPELYPRGYYAAATRAAVRQEIEIAGGDHMMYVTPGVGAGQLAARYYTRWLERFLMNKADPEGYTTGALARSQRQQGTLVNAMFSERGTATPPPAPSLLKKGSTGQAVKDVQAKLKGLGLYAGAIDGDFGPLTEEAVKRFQTSRGLGADGVVGPRTRAALGL